MSLKVKARRAVAPRKLYDVERDGVTFSLLSQFLMCRERTRLGLQGYTPTGASLGQVFGGIAHEALHRIYDRRRLGHVGAIAPTLDGLERVWHREHPMPKSEDLEVFERAMMLNQSVLPIYFTYWRNDFSTINWDRLESEFSIPWTTHRGLVVPLRGKIDGAFHRKTKRPWLFETKTKAQIAEGAIADIMPHELQVNTYLAALRRLEQTDPAGVLYNIVRRPQLRQSKTEAWDAFVARVTDDVRARPDFYFVRMEMSVDRADLNKAEEELTDLVTDFVDWWTGVSGHYKNSNQCENKYGRCPMLAVCSRRDFSFVYQRDRVFMELEEW